MLEITADHVKELATLYGENVLVPMPCEHPPAGSLWVIGTANQHYNGYRTVYATSDQVTDMIAEYGDGAWDDDEVTDFVAETIAIALNALPRADAVASAYTMTYPDGFSGRVATELG